VKVAEFGQMKPTDPAQFISNTTADGHSVAPADRDRFALVPETSGFDYCCITESLASLAGLRPIPVRIKNGDWKTRGIAHMLHKHHAGIALMGYYSVQDFVLDVSTNFDRVYRGRDGKWIIVIARGGGESRDRLLILDDNAGLNDCYSIVSG
jgi:hypothetical protein